MSAESVPHLPPLTFRRRIPARRERVFATWTDPEQIRRWLGGPGVEVRSARVDLREAGEYEYQLTNPDGTHSRILGSFLTVAVPEKLVFSWAIENAAGRTPTTQVTVEFLDLGEQTDIVLTHQRFLDDPTRELHREGWEACFANLTELLLSTP